MNIVSCMSGIKLTVRLNRIAEMYLDSCQFVGTLPESIGDIQRMGEFYA